MASWAIDRKIISSAQKGFLLYEGCADHSFLLRSVFEDSKRRQKSLRVVWLDFKNAFGSVPHSVVWEMMHHLDITSHFIDICREINHSSTQTISASGGQTSPIPVTRGIKQGCPLSPLLFNFVPEGLLPVLSNNYSGYQFRGGARVRCLTYADDLCLIGQSKEDINDMLQVTNLFFNLAGLELNPSKCGALSMINSRRLKYVEPFEPLIDEFNSIPALKWEDAYKYLGVSTGKERRGSMDNLSQSMLKAADKILSSGLADWQKLDAINIFVISKASYYLNSSILNVTWASKMDASLRSLLKKALRFPKRTTNSFLYCSKAKGGLGLFSVLDRLHTSCISRSIKCLTSHDKLVSDIAWSQLYQVVKCLTSHDKLVNDIAWSQLYQVVKCLTSHDKLVNDIAWSQLYQVVKCLTSHDKLVNDIAWSQLYQVVKCLTSHDKLVNDIAWSQLYQVVKQRCKLNEVTVSDVNQFFNNPSQERATNDVTSIWNSVRKSLAYTGCSITIVNADVSLSYNDVSVRPHQRQPLTSTLGGACENKHFCQFVEASDHG